MITTKKERILTFRSFYTEKSHNGKIVFRYILYFKHVEFRECFDLFKIGTEILDFILIFI